MRVIKLSSKDPDMLNRSMVDTYFSEVLQSRTPQGQFLLTRSRIAQDGIQPNERLVFTYEGDVVYQARAKSGRIKNLEKTESEKYPHYFCVEIGTIQAGCKSLEELESELREADLIPQEQNLVKSQGWPIVEETDDEKLSEVLNRFIKE